ncbi:MAG TPA: hypothetical protein VFW29_02610 [Solirubrobacteraceae bacterium]|nr:hypothetical protein [Solirubrobacteraceae bacterium]
MLLSELTRAAPRLALVGLAKNTGKTVTLNALLAELSAAGTPVGVTSVGRDGEQHDVIDFRIDKPRVRLEEGSLVATTDALLSASGTGHELLDRTGIGTPLGEVVIARLLSAGEVEVAGPSAAQDARAMADAMLAHGAEQALIDGAIDRRAASSPHVADGLVACTGAVLSEDVHEVVARTREAIELVRLPTLAADGPLGAAAHALALAGSEHGAAVLSADGAGAALLPARYALTAQAAEIAALLAEHRDAAAIAVSGALPESFVRDVALAARRSRREITLVVADATHVFVHERGVEHYRAQGVRLAVLAPIDLLALTVNPVAPQSHSFDSARLRDLLSEEIAGVPIFDVLHPSYRGAQPPVSRALRSRP